MKVARIGPALFVAGLLILILAAVKPISGSNIMGTDVALKCGPALMAWLGVNDPEPSGPAIIWPESDTGVSRGAWCDLEARKWVWPVGRLGLLVTAVGVLVSVGASIRNRRRVQSEPTR